MSDVALNNRSRGEKRFGLTGRSLLPLIVKALGPLPVRLILADGLEASPLGIDPEFTVRISDTRTLMELAVDPEIGFGEAYAAGRVQVEGDLVSFLEAMYQPIAGANPFRLYGWLTSKWLEWWQRNTLRGSRNNIHHHYDLGEDFFKLWLDSNLVYTCAYFPTPSATLEEAQEAKMDYVCRKLQLRAGETVVEAGCGWGALALYMARKYGTRVKAFNISKEQIQYARRRACEMGLQAQVEFIEDDYRNISGKFDVFVSVGMLEHVGLSNYDDFGQRIHQVVGDTGRGLIHFIGRNSKAEFSRWIRKRIFPGAYAPTLREALHLLELHNYSVLDVENLRPHYARTLEHWLERFERSSQEIAALYNPWFERAWRLYLAGSIAGFRTGALQLFQVVFAGPQRPVSSCWTRAPLYINTNTSD